MIVKRFLYFLTNLPCYNFKTIPVLKNPVNIVFAIIAILIIYILSHIYSLNKLI